MINIDSSAVGMVRAMNGLGVSRNSSSIWSKRFASGPKWLNA
jgi:hypothetical protein